MFGTWSFLRFTFGAALLGCLAAPSAQAAGGDPIGVAMPTKSSARWIDDGNNIVKLLRAKGYKPTCNTPTTTSRTSSPRSRT